MSDRLGDPVRLQHILDAIREINQYVQGVEHSTFVSDSMMYNATLRQLEIIGEASSRLSVALVQENNQVPWPQIVGLRNLVIHEYFGVDDMIIWNIVQYDLPELKRKIQVIVDQLNT